MLSIVVYSKINCAFCTATKQFLSARGLPWEERILGVDFQTEDLLAKAPGAKAYPQIFVNDRHVGGYPELTSRINEIVAEASQPSNVLLLEDFRN